MGKRGCVGVTSLSKLGVAIFDSCVCVCQFDFDNNERVLTHVARV